MDTVLSRFDEKLLWDADRVVVSPGVPLENHGLLELLQSVGHCSMAYIVHINFVSLYCYSMFFCELIILANNKFLPEMLCIMCFYYLVLGRLALS